MDRTPCTRRAGIMGRPQGPEGSLGKLASSHVARQAARVHTYLTGSDALLSGKDSPMEGVIAEILVSVPATSIAGGTDEIQHNIIAERVLEDAQGVQRRHRQALQGRAEEHNGQDVSLVLNKPQMSRPLIGVTLDAEKPGGYSKFPWYALRQNYLDAIDAAGGLPVALPHEPDRVADYLERIDALVVTGGAFDVDPSYYGGGAMSTRPSSPRTAARRSSSASPRAHSPRTSPCWAYAAASSLLARRCCGGKLIQHIPDTGAKRAGA